MLTLAALGAGWLMLHWRPTGFYGGATDDQRYLDTALAWWHDGPQAGTTHWSLRHPLILSILAAFRLFGASIEAMIAVPRFYALLTIAITVPMLARVAGTGAALLWVALFLLSPILHEMGTSTFPEMVELAFAAASLWLFFVAQHRPERATLPLALSGAALACAVLTRETAAVLLFGYIFVALRRPTMPLFRYAWLAAGFVPVLAADLLWLYTQTGDPLYRLHVDAGHIGIASAHLRGGVYHGTPFLNPDLASRWLPAGPTRLHWTVNPIVDFLIDPRFGLIFVAWIVLAWTRRGALSPAYRALRPALIFVAIGSFVMVTWVLTLRPQPRYYLLPVYAATVAVALLAPPLIADIRHRKRVWKMLGLVAFVGAATIFLSPERTRTARILTPYLLAHPGLYHLDEKTAARMVSPLAEVGIADRATAAAVPVGGVRVRTIPMTADDAPGNWRTIAVLPGGDAAWRKHIGKIANYDPVVERRLR